MYGQTNKHDEDGKDGNDNNAHGNICDPIESPQDMMIMNMRMKMKLRIFRE